MPHPRDNRRTTDSRSARGPPPIFRTPRRSLLHTPTEAAEAPDPLPRSPPSLPDA